MRPVKRSGAEWGTNKTVLLAVFGAYNGAMKALLFCLLVLAGCSPRVEVTADKPITVNLNVKIDHEIRVKVDKQVENLLNKDSEGIF
jgi:hypothetical protein